MDFWRYLSGVLTVRFTSATPEKTLDVITQAKIPLSHVLRINELTYVIEIQRKDYSQLAAIFRRREDHWEMVRKRGFFWILSSLIRRPILMLGILLLLICSLFLPSRVFFIAVYGNTTIPDRLILSAAEDCGIRFAASRKLVRSEKVKNALLAAVPQLQWAGVNTAGCTAVISVREKVVEDSFTEHNIVSSLISNLDGYILSTTVTSGTPLVFPGDSVTKGQLLISGYTDCGLCIRASRAVGDILAQTNRKIKAVSPKNYDFPKKDPKVFYQLSLLLGKKRINLWKDSRISDAGCGRMYEEYFVSLPGGFRLPIAVCLDRYVPYEIQNVTVPESTAKDQLQDFSDAYLLRQMISGRIQKKRSSFSQSDNLYTLDSSYTCTEMIGREQREQIGVINGKRN